MIRAVTEESYLDVAVIVTAPLFFAVRRPVSEIDAISLLSVDQTMSCAASAGSIRAVSCADSFGIVSSVIGSTNSTEEGSVV